MVLKESEFSILVKQSIEKYTQLFKYYDSWVHCVLIPISIVQSDNSIQEEMKNLLSEEHINYKGDSFNWCLEIIESDEKQVSLRVIETWE